VKFPSRCGAFILAGAMASLDAPAAAAAEQWMRIEKVSDRITELTAKYDVPRLLLFDALTRPEHLTQWMSADGFTLESAEVDGRDGGGFRYVYRRPNGALIEVRGAYSRFDPPRGFSYVETYDFSPLRVEVEVELIETRLGTRFTQTLLYASKEERDEDFEGVASSSREAHARLARYLTGSEPGG
jgi:uncharacterized protein YndB with AHSA1/START domain